MDIESNGIGAAASRKLPVKTKAAMWFIFLVAGIEVLYEAWAQAHPNSVATESGITFLFDLIYPVLYVLPAFVLLRKSRSAFIAAVSILSAYLIFLFCGIGMAVVGGYDFGQYLGGSIFVLVPLILLALDVKNYWKITA